MLDNCQLLNLHSTLLPMHTAMLASLLDHMKDTKMESLDDLQFYINRILILTAIIGT